MSFLEAFYCCALIAFFSFLILKWKLFKLDGIKKSWVLFAFFIKVLAGVVLILIYTKYYSATDRKNIDIFRFYDDSEIMYSALKDNPKDFFKMLTGINDTSKNIKENYYDKMNNWFDIYSTVIHDDTRTIIRINAAFNVLSNKFFLVNSLFFVIISFIGLLFLFKTFVRYFRNNKLALFVACFLIPSVLLWSSGILKESILVFALGLFLFNYQRVIFSFNVKNIILFIICGAVLFSIKPYVFAILAPLIIANTWIVITNNRFPIIKQSSILLLCLIAAIVIGKLYPDYDVFDLIDTKLNAFLVLVNETNPGSYIANLPLKPNAISFLKLAPLGILTTLFRPLPWDISSIIMLPSLLENSLILLVILLTIFFFNKKIKHFRIIVFCLFFVLLLSALVGLTTPVLGALVRYRMPMLPFLFIALFLLIDFDKMLLFFKIKKIGKNE